MSTFPTYHVEVLTKIKLLRVSLWGVEASKPRLGCKFDQEDSSLVIVLFNGEQAQPALMISIPIISSIQVDLKTAQLELKEDYISCTFKIAFQGEATDYMWNVTHPKEAPIPLSSVSSLSCRVCRHKLFSQAHAIEKTQLMPTEHWGDMRELWTCACTASLYEKIVPRSTVIRAQSGTLQVGPSYLQLNGSDLDLSLLAIDPDEPHTVAFHRNWKTVWCVRCGAQLGSAEMPNSDTIGKVYEELSNNPRHSHHEAIKPHAISNDHSEKTSSSISHPISETPHDMDQLINKIIFSNVKLDKHQLYAEQNLFEDHRLETKISSDILSIISITGCFKIHLRDFRTREPRLELKILGWDSLVLSTHAAPTAPDLPYLSLMPVIRLSYSLLGPTTSGKDTSQSEMIETDSFSIERLITTLVERHNRLPRGVSTVGSQTLSYMYYIPPER